MSDVLSVLEATYSERVDAEAWVKEALSAIHPNLDRGAGVLAYRYEHRAEGIWTGPFHEVGAGGAPALELAQKVVQGVIGMSKREDWQRLYPLEPRVAWCSELAGDEMMAEMRDFLCSLVGVTEMPPTDSVGIIAGDASGHGCLFYTTPDKAPSTARTRKAALPPHVVATWRRVAAHLVAGHRLARHGESKVDAVLSPAGDVLHLERKAQEHGDALRLAARAINRARGPLRRTNPERALRIWRDVVAGRWSLVDHFDHDNRRYVLAKRNAPASHRWSSLTEREARVVAELALGKSYKAIADALGISIATVGLDLAGARDKLGARSRVELAAAYRAAHGK